MRTHLRNRGASRLLASLALAISTIFAIAGAAAAANPNRAFDVTACTTPNEKSLVLTVTWSGVEVSAWSYYFETTEGSGGVFESVPQEAESGTFTRTFPGDVSAIQSVSVTVFRSAGPNYVEVGTETILEPATSVPRC